MRGMRGMWFDYAHQPGDEGDKISINTLIYVFYSTPPSPDFSVRLSVAEDSPIVITI
ncbi:MAG TPA: hypothetical protein V6D25_16895 [Leptolyngbyaceae cyanobacterium]